jgi:hypothetical protein
MEVHGTEVMLRACIALVGGLSIPFYGLVVDARRKFTLMAGAVIAC